MTRLKIGFVCQWYPPEPALQPLWIAESLEDRAGEVRVLTAFPNYPLGVVYSGYRPWLPKTEQMDGKTVHRAPVYASHDQSAGRRMLNYLSWAVASSLLVRRWLSDVDVTLVYSSPATAAMPAMVLRRLRGTPYVLLIQDVWPDSVTSSGFVGGRLVRIVERLLAMFVNCTYRGASAIAVISPGMKDLLVQRGVAAEKITVVHNWVRETPPAQTTGLRDTLGLDQSDLVIMYAGNHGAAQNLGPVVETFARDLPDEIRCHLVLVGDGVEKAQLQRAADGSSRVHFHDPVAAGVISEWAQEADAQLISLADRPLFRVTTPSKLQAIISAGRPVLAVAAGDVARTVRQADCGIAVRPGDRLALSLAVQDLARRSPSERAAMGSRGSEHYLSQMSEDVGATTLMTILRAAATQQTTTQMKGTG